MQRVRTWLIRLGVGVLVLILGYCGTTALMPVPHDPVPEVTGAGASSVEPSFSGLQREFPPLNEPPDNPTTPEKAALGRLLFFDPILSANNDISCATCHHPDYGFADGLPRAIGAGGSGVGPNRTGGVELARNTPTLWNVGYATSFFWDGRSASLEEELFVPLTHPDEMGVDDPQALVDELRAIPEYVELFDQAFGGGESAVSVENIQRAIAAFERTLISNMSPFDRYAAGDVNALTPQQRRGLNLFRSAATRCFECHIAPTFASDTFRIIGVPDAPGLPHDPGRAGVTPDGQDGAFKVPTLRNIALTAPYMHNGVFQTLEEVIDFYAQGGGRAHGVENVDPFVQGFDLTEQEKADLVAFLYALTDESNMPPIPQEVPSGLPVVPRLDNPARDLVAQFNAKEPPNRVESGVPRILRVEPGETIQAVVDRARPGDTIEVPYGVYHERVVIDMSDISLIGVPNESGEWPVLDGQGKLADGVIASGNNFEMAFFQVKNYTDNGVLVEGVRGVHLHDLYVEKTGTYGVYPVHSTDVLIERVEATGVDDAGIYAGQCENVVVRDSVAYGNVIGIEIENTDGFEMYNNHVYDNSVGLFVDLLPQLTSKVARNGKVYNNISERNNTPNFAPAGSTASLAPAGTGLLVLAADYTEIFDNVIRDNQSVGIAIVNLALGFDENEIDVGPNPEFNWVHDNELVNNGYDPVPEVTSVGLPGADIIWDGSGDGNRFDQPGASSFPPLLPSSSWPEPLYRSYWHTLNIIKKLLM